jgi:GT2 family glycosyltransferase
MLVRQEAFAALGGFDEAFFLYYEETDLCYRLAMAGWQVHYAPAATIAHVGGASTGQDHLAPTLQLFASLIRFYRLHYSRRQLRRLRIVVAATMGLKVMRDRLRVSLSPDQVSRERLLQDIQIWEEIRALFRHEVPFCGQGHGRIGTPCGPIEVEHDLR